MDKFDVWEVDLNSLTVKLVGENKSEKTAQAIEQMAIMRRMTDNNFFVIEPAGKYAEGDTWRREE